MNTKLKDSEPYILHEVTDKVIGVDTLNLVELRGQRKRFCSGIGSNAFKIGKWTYKIGGQIPNTTFVFRIPANDSLSVEKNPCLSHAIASASLRAQSTKSVKETLADIKRIQAATSTKVGRIRALAILRAISSGSVRYATTSQPEREALADELAILIASADKIDEDKTIDWLDDLRTLNGKERNTLIEPFWSAVERVVEMDGVGAHRRRHAEKGGLEDTVNINYSPSINSLEALQKATLKQLKDIEGKEEGKDFIIPSI